MHVSPGLHQVDLDGVYIDRNTLQVEYGELDGCESNIADFSNGWQNFQSIAQTERLRLGLIRGSDFRCLQSNWDEGSRRGIDWLSIDLEELIIIGDVEFEVLKEGLVNSSPKQRLMFEHTILTESSP